MLLFLTIISVSISTARSILMQFQQHEMVLHLLLYTILVNNQFKCACKIIIITGL